MGAAGRLRPHRQPRLPKAAVGPNDGYEQLNSNPSEQIWRADLEINDTVLLRAVVGTMRLRPFRGDRLRVMDLDAALSWAAGRTEAVIITIRRDGRSQSSDISYGLTDGVFGISITNGRAKTANMRRDPRVVLHLSDRASWSYLSFDGTVELSPVATEPCDATCDALVEYYQQVAGKAHPDWNEYRLAMVDEGRLLVRFTPTSVVGQIH